MVLYASTSFSMAGQTFARVLLVGVPNEASVVEMDYDGSHLALLPWMVRVDAGKLVVIPNHLAEPFAWNEQETVDALIKK